MYYYFHGIVTLHLKDSIVIETSGVGYDLLVSNVENYPIGEIQYVYVVYYQNENESYFIGFKTIDEKEMFLKITSVKGVGPKTALNMFKNSSIDRLKSAIKEGDDTYLSSLPGIGKKTATQIILDLRNKFVVSSDILNNKNMKLAYDGLISLGFKDKEIKMALNNIKDPSLSVEEYITLVLKNKSN